MSKAPTVTSGSNAVAAFLKKAEKVPAPFAGPRGRLIFAMDATASRGPTWTQAIAIQSEMFREAATVGALDVQLAYFRGLMEFAASPWLGDATQMAALMRSVHLVSGQTQIERTLRHAAEEARRQKVNAVVFIGDAMEEMSDAVIAAAGKLGLLGVPVFIFHEGGAEPAGSVFRQIASLTRGAYAPFDANSAQQLRDLLKAVAVYAAGGRKALEDLGRKSGGAALQLTHSMGGKP